MNYHILHIKEEGRVKWRIYQEKNPQEFWSSNTCLHKTVCALYDKPWSAAHKVLKRLFSASLNEYKAKTTFLGQEKTFQLSLKILTNFFIGSFVINLLLNMIMKVLLSETNALISFLENSYRIWYFFYFCIHSIITLKHWGSKINKADLTKSKGCFFHSWRVSLHLTKKQRDHQIIA